MHAHRPGAALSHHATRSAGSACSQAGSCPAATGSYWGRSEGKARGVLRGMASPPRFRVPSSPSSTKPKCRGELQQASAPCRGCGQLLCGQRVRANARAGPRIMAQKIHLPLPTPCRELPVALLVPRTGSHHHYRSAPPTHHHYSSAPPTHPPTHQKNRLPAASTSSWLGCE